MQRHLDARGWNNTDLANAGDFDRSLVGRWLNEGKAASIDSIRAVCMAFGRDIREGLVASGMFTAEELRVAQPGPPDMEMISDEGLLVEVARRMTRKIDEGDSLLRFARVFTTQVQEEGVVHLARTQAEPEPEPAATTQQLRVSSD